MPAALTSARTSAASPGGSRGVPTAPRTRAPAPPRLPGMGGRGGFLAHSMLPGAESPPSTGLRTGRRGFVILIFRLTPHHFGQICQIMTMLRGCFLWLQGISRRLRPYEPAFGAFSLMSTRLAQLRRLLHRHYLADLSKNTGGHVKYSNYRPLSGPFLDAHRFRMARLHLFS